MGPGEVELAPPRDKGAESSESQSFDAVTRQEILPITGEQLRKVAERLPLTIMSGVRVFGDVSRHADSADIPPCVCCHCECWDLTKQADRDAYSELYSKLSAGANNIEVLWQERLNDQGKLIIYITYVESLRIVDAENVLKEIRG